MSLCPATCSTIPDPEIRKALGAFYTPDRVAEILTAWVFRGRPGRMLDPSYGGCAFLGAAARHLTDLGVPRPGEHLVGVDIDQGCVVHIQKDPLLFGTTVFPQDFLTLDTNSVPFRPVDAVAGNPPYVRHHLMSVAQATAARKAVRDSGVALSAKSDLWAYFIIHAVRFLRNDGRMALILPQAVLEAEYAAPVRSFLSQRFQRLTWIRLRERIFDGTDEQAVVLLAEPAARSEERVLAVEDVKELGRAVALAGGSAQLVAGSEGEHEALMSLNARPEVMPFGDLAEIRIGLVTGANSHFLVTSEQRVSLELGDDDVVPLVSRTRWLSGLTLGEEDFQRADQAGLPVWLLVSPAADDLPAGIQSWVMAGEREGVHTRYKCANRRPWYRVEPGDVPDAFATCSRLLSPRVVLNRTGCRATNALHHVTWKSRHSPHDVATGVLTSLTALNAELSARHYGGGVLKMEPGIWNRLPVPVVDVLKGVLARIDALLRAGEESKAREAADDAVLVKGMGISVRQVEAMQAEIQRLQAWRRPHRVSDE